MFYNYLLKNDDFFLVFYESVIDRRTEGRSDGRTDGPTDGRRDRPSYRDARTHLKSVERSSLSALSCCFSPESYVVSIPNDG